MTTNAMVPLCYHIPQVYCNIVLATVYRCWINNYQDDFAVYMRYMIVQLCSEHGTYVLLARGLDCRHSIAPTPGWSFYRALWGKMGL